jgi:hypothetical protein
MVTKKQVRKKKRSRRVSCMEGRKREDKQKRKCKEL